MSRTQYAVSTLLVALFLVGGAHKALADEEAVRLRCSAATEDWTELSCVKTVDDRRELEDRTHISLFPSGNLLRKGDVQFQVHEFGLFNRAAFGVSDNVELSVGAPAIPVFTTLGGRVGLTSRDSRYRLVLGGSLWLPLIADADETLVQASATVAYQDDKVNLHATAGGIKPSGEDEALAVYSAGVAYKSSKKTALFAEVLRLALFSTAGDACTGADDYDCEGSSRDYFDGAMVGVKIMGKHFDTDLGLFMPFGDSEVVGLPVISMTYRY